MLLKLLTITSLVAMFRSVEFKFKCKERGRYAGEWFVLEKDYNTDPDPKFYQFSCSANCASCTLEVETDVFKAKKSVLNPDDFNDLLSKYRQDHSDQLTYCRENSKTLCEDYFKNEIDDLIDLCGEMINDDPGNFEEDIKENLEEEPIDYVTNDDIKMHEQNYDKSERAKNKAWYEEMKVFLVKARIAFKESENIKDL